VNHTRDDLVNAALVRHWAVWALVWLTLFPLVGLLVSVKFHAPDFLGGVPWLTFGRLRPVHVNGVIFGAFSTGFIALLYYYVPRLCGVRLFKEAWGWWLLWLWNLFIVAGSASLMMGQNTGLEAGEFTWPLAILRYAVLFFIAIQVLGTVARRTEQRFYVGMWYTTAAVIWTLMNLIIGDVLLPYAQAFTGINSAAMHGLYIHYIVGLWLTPAGLALIYYFLPLSAQAPLHSHRLSLLGFWSLAFFYPFVGIHHYLYSPIPAMNQTMSIATSMLLIIPVWAVTVNFFGTMKGRWGTVLGGGGGANYAAKFLMLGAVYYLIGCFQGSTEALRRLQELTHFNDFVISHSHLTVFGAMVVWAIGGLYYVWPKVTGRHLWSDRLASWHLWLTISGFSVMAVVLTVMGFVQGSMLERGTNFVDTVKDMKPWWVARSISGFTMDIGFVLMVINFYQTAKRGVPAERKTDTSLWQDTPASAMPTRGRWIESPSTVFLIAGIAFFFLAVLVQGIMPWTMPETRTTVVIDEVTRQPVQVADYTPEEARGRRVYIREGCWYCHSQFIRPVTGENFRWGPVSQAGEYAYDFPHLLSTRRIGPDLTRVGRKYADDWHVAHHWAPQSVVPDSIMPAFPWLFEPEAEGAPPRLNADGEALVAYIQRLGTGIGDWRSVFPPTRLSAGATLTVAARDNEALMTLGKEVYARRCVGCHGEKGDGDGPAAKFLNPKPRDFTRGIFKFRSTSGTNSLPTDADLFNTITHGLWGTAMPPWQNISDRERLAVISRIKAFSDRWQREPVEETISISPEPPVTTASLDNGRRLFHGDAGCFVCHGTDGRGDGPLAATLTDTWGHPARPADFTLPAGVSGGVKLGHHGRHIFRTIMTGVGGTPMPPFEGRLAPPAIWNIVHYVQSLRVDAHATELVAAGLAEGDRGEAISAIWASLSDAAARNAIEASVLERTAARLEATPARVAQIGPLPHR
jgi:cytochrome c oxidase cbb3-type subunit 1